MRTNLRQNTENVMVQPMLSPADFARLLGIGKRTFQTWRANGRLPHPDLHMGKIVRWQRETIDHWLEQSRTRSW